MILVWRQRIAEREREREKETDGEKERGGGSCLQNRQYIVWVGKLNLFIEGVHMWNLSDL